MGKAFQPLNLFGNGFSGSSLEHHFGSVPALAALRPEGDVLCFELPENLMEMLGTLVKLGVLEILL